MRVGALIRSYGLTDYLRPVINQYKWVDEILVMNYRFPNTKPRKDETRAICEELGVKCDSGEGLDQHEVLNKGIEQFRDFDFVFFSDADEFITKEDQMKLINEIEEAQIGCAQIIDYIGDPFHKQKARGHYPVVIVRPKNVLFTGLRNISYLPTKIYHHVNVHHFGNLYSVEQRAWKMDWESKVEPGVEWKKIDSTTEETVPPQEIMDMVCA